MVPILAVVCRAVSGQLSVLHSKEEWYVFSSSRLLFACLLPDRDRGRPCDSVCLTSAAVIAGQLKSPRSELASGTTACMDEKTEDLLFTIHWFPLYSVVQYLKVG